MEAANHLMGTGVALITPFKEDNSIDFKSLDKLVNYQIENGVNYLVILGTTGESVTLTSDEKETVCKSVIKSTKNRVPIVIGIGGNNTQAVAHQIENTDLSPYSAVLSVSPAYNKPTQQGIYEHYKTLALASSKPLILYNVPGRTGQNMNPETSHQLAADFKNIIAIKEAGGSMEQVFRLIKNKPTGFDIISGDDMLALPTVLAGGIGVISVLGQGLPKEFSSLISDGLADNSKKAYASFYTIKDAIDFIFEEGNPAGIKCLLKELGVIESAKVRLPLVEASSPLISKIKQFVASL